MNNFPGRNNLCFLDLSESILHIQEIPDTIPVLNPTISPDGRFVAFSTGLEGVDGPSSIYIRRLDAEGSHLVKLPVEAGYLPRWRTSSAQDTFLVFSSSVIDNSNQALWPHTVTLQYKISDGRPAGPLDTVILHGSYHDGFSADNRYYGTSFTRLLVYDRQTETQQTLFTSPMNGKDSLGSQQVCNLSFSPHTDTPFLSFLDFGYPRKSGIIGGPYSFHEFIFISDLHGNIIKTIPRPDETDAWDHPEWSNHPGYLASGSTDSGGKHANIYLIRFEDGSSLKILSGHDLWHPYLWLLPQ